MFSKSYPPRCFFFLYLFLHLKYGKQLETNVSSHWAPELCRNEVHSLFRSPLLYLFLTGDFWYRFFREWYGKPVQNSKFAKSAGVNFESCNMRTSKRRHVRTKTVRGCSQRTLKSASNRNDLHIFVRENQQQRSSSKLLCLPKWISLVLRPTLRLHLRQITA